MVNKIGRTRVYPGCFQPLSLFFARLLRASQVRNLPANTGDARNVGLIPGSGRSPGVRNGNPLQYSCLENSKWTEKSGGIISSWDHKELETTEHACMQCSSGSLVWNKQILIPTHCFGILFLEPHGCETSSIDISI